MLTILTSLAFAVAAVIAALAIAGTWLRYRSVVLDNLAALREVEALRSFHVGIVTHGRQAALGAPQGGRRQAKRAAAPVRRLTVAGLRAAA